MADAAGGDSRARPKSAGNVLKGNTREAIDSYLAEQKIAQIFEELLTRIIVERPHNALLFIETSVKDMIHKEERKRVRSAHARMGSRGSLSDISELRKVDKNATDHHVSSAITAAASAVAGPRPSDLTSASGETLASSSVGSTTDRKLSDGGERRKSFQSSLQSLSFNSSQQPFKPQAPEGVVASVSTPAPWTGANPSEGARAPANKRLTVVKKGNRSRALSAPMPVPTAASDNGDTISEDKPWAMPIAPPKSRAGLVHTPVKEAFLAVRPKGRRTSENKLSLQPLYLSSSPQAQAPPPPTSQPAAGAAAALVDGVGGKGNIGGSARRKRRATCPEKISFSAAFADNTPKGIGMALDSFPLFKDCSLEVKRRLADSMGTRSYRLRDTIVRAGEMAKAMFFIMRGEVEVVSEDGEVVFAQLKAGNYFGEVGLLFSVPRTASVRAASNCIIMVLTKENFETILRDEPLVAVMVKREADKRMQALKERAKSSQSAAYGGEFQVDAICQTIQDIPLFKFCEVGFLHQLAVTIEPRLVQAGEYIVRKGDIGMEMFFIVRGTVEVVSEDGASVITCLSSGSFFGEIGVLFKLPRTVSVRAQTACDLLVLLKDSLEKVVEGYPEISRQIKAEGEARLQRVRAAQEAGGDYGARMELEVTRENLKKVKLFAGWDENFLHLLSLHMHPRKYAAGARVFSAGDPVDFLLFIERGKVEAVSEDGEMRLEFGAGNVVGELEFCAGIECTGHVSAVEDTLALTIRRDKFDVILTDFPDIAATVSELKRSLESALAAADGEGEEPTGDAGAGESAVASSSAAAGLNESISEEPE